MTAVFVTGTGTDVGKEFVTGGVIRHLLAPEPEPNVVKTFVTPALIRHLRAACRPVEALKPVVSGFDPDATAISDPSVLLAALGRAPSQTEIERMSPWRFRAPLSPDLAAAREG